MFTGYTGETVDFLWGIRFNSRRDWFEDHKEVYLEHLYRPTRALGEELLERMLEKRPDLVCKVTRIYRDARRLHGKGPYKESLWFTLERPSEQWSCRPAFWFEIMPDGWSYGMGYWMPRPVTMAKLRARICRDPGTMEDLTRRLARQAEFHLETEEYKRPRAAPPSPELDPWFRAKSLSLAHREELTEELFSREIVGHLERGFTFLLPYFDYFDSLEGDPDPAGPDGN